MKSTRRTERGTSLRPRPCTAPRPTRGPVLRRSPPRGDAITTAQRAARHHFGRIIHATPDRCTCTISLRLHDGLTLACVGIEAPWEARESKKPSRHLYTVTDTLELALTWGWDGKNRAAAQVRMWVAGMEHKHTDTTRWVSHMYGDRVSMSERALATSWRESANDMELCHSSFIYPTAFVHGAGPLGGFLLTLFLLVNH